MDKKFLDIFIKVFSVLILLWAITSIFMLLFAFAVVEPDEIKNLLPYVIFTVIPVIFSIFVTCAVLKKKPKAYTLSVLFAVSYFVLGGLSLILKADLKFEQTYEKAVVTKYHNIPENDRKKGLSEDEYLQKRINEIENRRFQGFALLSICFVLYSLCISKRRQENGASSDSHGDNVDS